MKISALMIVLPVIAWAVWVVREAHKLGHLRDLLKGMAFGIAVLAYILLTVYLGTKGL